MNLDKLDHPAFLTDERRALADTARAFAQRERSGEHA